MNKSDLLRKLKEKRDTFPEEDLESSINLILHFISRTLQEANRVEIRNFGTFSARKRAKRISRNPKTGTSVLVEPKYHPYFRASKNLKESLNQ
jgi:integration host factor subunit beta